MIHYDLTVCFSVKMIFIGNNNAAILRFELKAKENNFLK